MIRLVLRAAIRRRCSTHPSNVKHTRSRPWQPSSILHVHNQRRAFGGIPTVLLPPVIFGGLMIILWTWKCIMMVVFQNKIIYMPGLPPNARRETLKDYKNQCGGIVWKEERTKTADGTQISLCVASVNSGPEPMKTVYILYFQGNASSLPPRLPFLSPVLRMLRNSPFDDGPVRYTMLCCSYRGYWTSRGRPSEKGIAKDAHAALAWIKSNGSEIQSSNGSQASQVIIWGQSIGAGVATNLVAESRNNLDGLTIETLILETPFLSIKAMLETLYPQKWLPYRYLWPFLRNHLDTFKALGLFGVLGKKAPDILILEAGKDELVPRYHGEELERRCVDVGLDVRRQIISGALHTEVMVRPEGRLAVADAIRRVAVRGGE